MWGFLKAFFVAAFGAFRNWRRDVERDALITERVQKDGQLVDQATTIRILRDADSVPRELTPDATGVKPERRGRRTSNVNRTL